MNLSDKLLQVFEAQYKSSTGKALDIPSGKWKHEKVSAEWEKNNDNDAKGKIGLFSKNGVYLEWQSQDGKYSFNIDVKDAQISDTSLHFKAKGGLEYWFKKA